MAPKVYGEKFRRFDVKMDAHGRIVELEVQVVNEGYFP
jgi:hypothetical protein